MPKKKRGTALAPAGLLGSPRPRGRPTNAFVLRARHLFAEAQALEVLANIVAGKEMEPRFIDQVKVPDPSGGTRTVREITYAPPMNKQKIDAAIRLAEVGRLVPHLASPTGSPEEPEVRWIVVLPKRARTTKEWLKMHQLGKA